LNRALLDVEVSPDLQTTLVYSSLALEAVKTTESSRDVVSLHIPEVLSPSEILDKWIKKRCTDLILTVSDEFRLKLCLSCFNSLPRSIYFFADFIGENPIGINSSLNNDYVDRLFQHLINEMKAWYNFNTFPNFKTFFSIITYSPQSVDAYSLRLIRGSTLINSLFDMLPDGIFYPKTAIIPLLLGSEFPSDSGELGSMVCEMIRGLIDLIINFKKKEDLLEFLHKSWMKIKLKSFSSLLNDISLDDFFTVNGSRDWSISWFLSNIDISFPKSDDCDYDSVYAIKLATNSTFGKEEFYQLLSTIQLTPEKPFVSVKLHSNESLINF
jgi:hypothetical protein